MLQSYEAIYDHGKLKWLSDKPSIEVARVIVTMLPTQPSQNVRSPSALISGKGKILGDIVAPASPASDWDVLK